MFNNTATLEYPGGGDDTLLPRRTSAHGFQVDAGSQARAQTLAAERALDSILADSFPASDPPSWTLGVTHPSSEPDATQADTTAVVENDLAATHNEDILDVSLPARHGRTFLGPLASVAGATGLALLVPFVIFVIGVPLTLAARGASGWPAGSLG